MVGAFVIVLDPIFQGLAVSLLFGVGASTVLTLIVIPVLYYLVYKDKHRPADRPAAVEVPAEDARPGALAAPKS
jgi:Cu/Ag efflux pump CusA